MLTARQISELYDVHAAGLFHYIVGILRSETEAKDLLQELFLKLQHQGLPAVESERAWLTRLAHNMTLDWLRRHRARVSAEEAAPAKLPRSSKAKPILTPPSSHNECRLRSMNFRPSSAVSLI